MNKLVTLTLITIGLAASPVAALAQDTASPAKDYPPCSATVTDHCTQTGHSSKAHKSTKSSKKKASTKKSSTAKSTATKS
jgi:hypothetical protein